jgi:CheY-like chemotaxis protein
LPTVVKLPVAFSGIAGVWMLENAALILVVEGEPIVRESVREQLEDQGYEIVEADSGEEAVTLLDKHREARGVIADGRLGGRHKLTGWDVARHVGN